MRGAWGKPYGTVARVNIGQAILSIRCKDVNRPVIMEALRRARYKVRPCLLSLLLASLPPPFSRFARSRRNAWRSSRSSSSKADLFPPSLRSSSFSVPWTTEDHCLQEVGIHLRQPTRLRDPQGREEGYPGRSLRSGESFALLARATSPFPSLLPRLRSSDHHFFSSSVPSSVQFLRPKGNLLQNLATSLRA